jgi:hypothetical protein
MSDNKGTYRRANGCRLEGSALAARVAQEVSGMMLAQAYVVAKSAGFQLRINKHDGVPRLASLNEAKRDDRVTVDVIGGFVRKSWVG